MKVRPIVNESALDCPECGAAPGNAHSSRNCFDMIQWAASVPEPSPSPGARAAVSTAQVDRWQRIEAAARALCFDETWPEKRADDFARLRATIAELEADRERLRALDETRVWKEYKIDGPLWLAWPNNPAIHVPVCAKGLEALADAIIAAEKVER